MAEPTHTLADTAAQALRSIERVGTSSPAFEQHRERLAACIEQLRAAEQAAGSRALADVVAERALPIKAGAIAERDDRHTKGELAWAAICYARAAVDTDLILGGLPLPFSWPFAATAWAPTTPRRNLVKAAALIVAEIERLDRAEAREADGQ